MHIKVREALLFGGFALIFVYSGKKIQIYFFYVNIYFLNIIYRLLKILELHLKKVDAFFISSSSKYFLILFRFPFNPC